MSPFCVPTFPRRASTTTRLPLAGKSALVTGAARRPNQKWVADLTRILTVEGVLWLASVRDVFSNKVVGWDSGARATTDLVVSALDYAIWSRGVRDGQPIHHSDKGCPSTPRSGSPNG